MRTHNGKNQGSEGVHDLFDTQYSGPLSSRRPIYSVNGSPLFLSRLFPALTSLNHDLKVLFV